MHPAYQDLARELPVPTAAQTLAFARFVAGAHSWYKHLSAFEAAPFTFFLDPNAGRALIRASNGVAAYDDITDASPQFHYAWQTTARWRDRFGHWNYRGPNGKSFRVATSAGKWEIGTPKLEILGPDGHAVAVNAAMVQAATAGVTSLVYRSDDWRATSPNRIDDLTHLIRDQFGRYYGQVAHVGPDADALLAQLPEEVAAAARRVMPVWLAQYEAEQRKPLFDLTLEWQQNPELDAEDPEPEPIEDPREVAFTAALDAERERLVGEMVAAMGRLVALLHGDRAG